MPTRFSRAVCVAVVTTACADSARDPAAASYDPENGRLRTLATDTNRNGTADAVSYMDGARIQRIELDLDENGQVERWDFYAAGGQLEKVGLSRENDGLMDAQAFYGRSGALERLELSTRRDGVFDRLEYYEDGILTASTEDTDRDGRPDKWDTYRAVTTGAPGEPGYAITSTSVDLSGSGRPERRFLYGPGGTIDRVEVDPDGDGVFVAASASP